MEEPNVISINLEKNEIIVKPFIFNAKPGEKFYIKSQTKTNVAIVIPNIKAFADTRDKNNYLQHRFPGNGKLEIKVSRYPIYGSYHYHVYLAKLHQFADKPNHSAPKIIIKE